MLHISQKDIEFLRPPKESESLQIPSENIKRGYQNNSQRSIFYNCELDNYEIQKIEEFKRELSSNNILLNNTWNDRELLKYVYSARFDAQRARNNLVNSLNWRAEIPKIPISHKTLELLHSGVFYQVGRDNQHRPNLIINLDNLDASKFGKDELTLVLAFYIDTIKQYSFLQGKIERLNIILDAANKDIGRFDQKSIERFINTFVNAYPQIIERVYVLNPSDSSKVFWQNLRNEELLSRVEFVSKENLKERFPAFQLERKHGGLLANITTFWPPSAVALRLPSILSNKQTVNQSSSFNQSSPSREFDGYAERSTVAADFMYRSPERREQNVSSVNNNNVTYERKTITTLPSNLSPERIFNTEEYNTLYRKKTLNENEKASKTPKKDYDFENQELLNLIINEYENLKTDKFLIERPENEDIVRLSTRLSYSNTKTGADISGEKVKRSAPRHYDDVSGHNIEEWSSGRYLKNTVPKEQPEEEDHRLEFCGICLTRKSTK